ncbi:hypothetical protein [Serratia sp. PL7]|uniref:hypothetical protein n=1 Tax=Serratia sp. PL7 TaxID=2952201 RepID=UPI0019D99391|nr:hypothetical protein [Serratia sp. PL7]MBE0148857.1 hypothetical protein [Serratia fonticola]
MDRRTFISAAVFSSCSVKAASKNVSDMCDIPCESNGIDFSGVKDSTIALQNLLDSSALSAISVPNGIQKKNINLHGVIRVSSQLVIDASKVNITGPVTIIFSKQGNYKGYGIFLNPQGERNAAYTNCVGSLFDSVNFFSEEKIDLIYASNSATSDSNPSCLINISQCRFTGFSRVFSNGPGGWGWCWDRCGFDQCEFLLFITKQQDTYERFSFSSCTWQNGGIAFYIDNPDGKVYWENGSFDYCEAIAHIVNGHVSVSGHLEFQGRTIPAVTLLGRGSSFVFNGGSIFIRKNKLKYTIFEQSFDNQVVLRDVNFVSDGINLSETVISNRAYLSSGINFGSSGTETILSNEV